VRYLCVVVVVGLASLEYLDREPSIRQMADEIKSVHVARIHGSVIIIAFLLLLLLLLLLLSGL